MNAGDLPAAEIKHIIFNYATQNGAAAINDVSFRVRKGECLLLTGLSGCGKTSILRVLNGLIPRYYEGTLSGSVLIGQDDIAFAHLCGVEKSCNGVSKSQIAVF